MELPDVFTIGLWSLGFLLLAALLPCLLRVRSHRFAWTAEPFSESTQPLANPYQGFYRIIRYTLSDDVPSGEAAIGADSYAHPLALLEINLKQFRTSAISENGLAQLNNILASWSRSPAHTRLILRFLYDWDGVAAAAEPESLTLVLTHMDQVAPVVNRYRDAVYLMQGIFIGNWGEMHHSRFSDDASLEMLIRHLNDIIDPSVYLSVRTPAQWRMVHNRYDLPREFPAFAADGSLMGRLGLFNDGILGSESDLGTYGNTARRDAVSPAEPLTREEELAFQNSLCRYVPNGGEVVWNHNLSNLETSVSVLRTMHVSYLNVDYDRRVLDAWRRAVWTGNDAFHGCDGYRYVQAHLGYRYLIRACRLKRSGWLRPALALSLTLQNTGFSNTMKPFRTDIVLKQVQTGVCSRIPFPMDLRRLSSGQTRSCSVKLPAAGLAPGCYRLYFSVADKGSGQRILLANKNEVTEHGYFLGQLEI